MTFQQGRGGRAWQDSGALVVAAMLWPTQKRRKQDKALEWPAACLSLLRPCLEFGRVPTRESCLYQRSAHVKLCGQDTNRSSAQACWSGSA